MILVSGCLLGISCRYDGKSKPNQDIIGMGSAQRLLPVCPEQLGGLPTPRPAAYVAGGDGFDVLAGGAKVLTVKGEKDVTESFVRGAMECVRLARLFECTRAILKSKSPSCGVNGQVGVLAAALILADLEVEEVD